MVAGIFVCRVNNKIDMIGAIIGDIVGSRFEFNNTKNFNFKLFTKGCAYTDDTICTIAIADAAMKHMPYGKVLHRWCREYPNPMGSYGCSFAGWIASNNPQPYNSFGNGSAMRVAAIGWLFDTLEQVEEEAMLSAMPTHNHREGIKGAVATASAIFLAHTQGKEAMLEAMKSYYPQWKEPRLGENGFDETCQGTMPVIFGIIQKANSFEEAIRYAIAVGGDSDTIGAIVGGIAEAIWGVPEWMQAEALRYLPYDMTVVVNELYHHNRFVCLNSDNFTQYSPLNPIALSVAEGGAMGSPGNIEIVESDGAAYYFNISCFHYDTLKIISPSLIECLYGDPEDWKHVDLGAGNHLFLIEPYYNEFRERLKLYGKVRPSWIYQNWKRIVCNMLSKF